MTALFVFNCRLRKLILLELYKFKKTGLPQKNYINLTDSHLMSKIR